MASKVEGKVIGFGPTGNLLTDITREQLADAPRDERVTVTCDEHQTLGIFPPDHDQPPMTYIALLGESGCLELAIVDDSAKIMLGVRVGERVTVAW